MDENFSNENGDLLIDKLLQKCEVSNLPAVYAKYLAKKSHICTLAEMKEFNGYFTEKNMKRDLKKIPKIISLYVYPDMFNGNSRNENNHAFEKIPVLADTTGLVKILKFYRKKHIIRKNNSVSELIEIFELENDNLQKFTSMLDAIVSKNQISAMLAKRTGNKEISLKFINKFMHPANRNLLYQLIITVAIGIILSFVILYITRIFP